MGEAPASEGKRNGTLGEKCAKWRNWLRKTSGRWIGFGLLVWAGSCFAQDLRYLSHQAWGTEEGLPQESVHAIAQTRDGYVWAATEGGLVRFDGISFKTYGRATDAAFESDDLCCLRAEADGSLLVGTASGWVSEREGRFERVASPEAVRGDGVRQARLLQPVNGERPVVSLTDREGVRWVGLKGGLAVVDQRTGKAQRVAALEGDSVLCLFEDAEGNHWVGTETSGLHLLRRLKFRSEPGMAGLAVTSVVQATDGAMWVGTREDGVRRVAGGIVSEPVGVERLTSGVVLALAPAAAGGVWVGTPDGLNMGTANGAARRFTSADGLPDDYVRTLATGFAGDVWVGTGHGLALVRDERVVRVLTSANGLHGDETGTVLFGPAWGSPDASKELWVASAGGVSVVAEDRVRPERAGDWLGGKTVSALAQDATRAVWAATEDGTVGRLAGRTRGVAVAFAGARIFGMMADQVGNLWFRMNLGIYRVSMVDLDWCVNKGGCRGGEIAVSRYGRSDGLPNDETVGGIAAGVWLARDGEMWFPTRRGVAVVDTRHLAVDALAPPVVVERVLVDDVAVTDGGEVKMPYGGKRLTVEYAGLSFTAPGEVRYRVRLQGFDKDWVDAGAKRSATYTNLAPGSYMFQVQAVNGDGVWNRVGTELRVRVVPPYWLRWWFVGLVLVVLAAVLAGGYLLRLRRLRRDFQVVLAERNRMAREIHDTLTQDFVGTSLQLDIVAQMLRRGKTDAALEQVVKTRRLVTDGLDEARRSIWELRANDAGDGLPVRLRRLVEREDLSGIGATVKIGGAYRQLEPEVEREVLRVAQEALQNVKRHAEATETTVDLHYSEEAVLLRIEDNGVGFRMEDVPPGHFGLVGMRERAGVVGGELDLWSEAGRGTKVRLRIQG